MRRLRCLVFIEVDVVVRHFIHSNTFIELCNKHEVKFIFPKEGNKRFSNINPDKLGLYGKYERLDHNEKRYNAWKQLFHIEQLKFKFGKQEKAMRNFRRKTLKWKAATLYTFFGLPIIWSIYSYIKYSKLLKKVNVDMLNLFIKFKPDLIIHPCVLEGLFINDLLQITKLEKIPSVVIMNSWDNPSTKSAMIGQPDWLLVWGEQTKNHSIQFCKMPKSKVVKFGAAQFEIYTKTSKLSKKKFDETYHYSKSEFILLYAGSSIGTNEIKQLNLLDEAINKGILKNLKIIYRPHPWGQGGQNGEKIIDMKWKNIVFDKSMIIYLKQLKDGVRSKFLSDYEDTHNILTNVDAVISPLSTILIEAAIHGKPSLCFLPDIDKSMHFEIDSALVHFQDIFASKLFLKANGYDELVTKTLKLIKFSKQENLSKMLKEEASYYVESFDQPYSKRLNEFVKTLKIVDNYEE